MAAKISDDLSTTESTPSSCAEPISYDLPKEEPVPGPTGVEPTTTPKDSDKSKSESFSGEKPLISKEKEKKEKKVKKVSGINLLRSNLSKGKILKTPPPLLRTQTFF